MKTNQHTLRVRKLRVCAGMLAALLLVSAAFWMVCYFGHACGQFSAQPKVPAPALGDLLAAR
ncbi:MAG TPA: hypothetical protein PLC99_20735 [Verrucomicrobiota bacterium]|nr:hypothetical protein [Verrucomicrobiota bacterium]